MLATETHHNDLSIGTFRTHCVALAELSQRFQLEQVLDKALSQTLPTALSAAIEPTLENQTGVVRVNTLKITVDHIGAFDEQALADAIAKQLAQSIKQLLHSSSNDSVLWWPSRLHYYAAYVEYRLALSNNVAPGWAFTQFATMDHLPAERAAAELIRSVPEILTALASAGAKDTPGGASRFAQSLEPQSANALVEALLPINSNLPEINLLIEAIRTIAASYERYSHLHSMMHALATLLDTLAIKPEADIQLELNNIVLALSLFQLTRSQTLADVHDSINENQVHVNHANITIPATAISILKQILSNEQHTLALQRVLTMTIQTASNNGTNKKVETPTNLNAHEHRSTLAGAALLLPIVLELGLFEQIGFNAVHNAVKSLFTEDQQTSLSHDTLFNLLFPINSNELLNVELGIPDLNLNSVASDANHLVRSHGIERWGEYILAVFATRLPGLQGSSKAYLMQQFINTPGRIVNKQLSTELILQGPDLAIILRMAGFSGKQCLIPHLNKRPFSIELTGLH